MKTRVHVLLATLLVLSGSMCLKHVLADKANTTSLGGPVRYLTAVSTDKPIYKPGEKVYVRGVLLNAANHTPLPTGEQAQATIEIKGPKGDTVTSAAAQTQDSVWGFAYDIPKDMAGGEYTVKVTYPWYGHAPAERKFDIRAYRAPRLKSQIVFLRDGYGPGEKVTATLHTERAEGGIPEGAKVSVQARVDGASISGADCKIDAKGNCTATFDLPAEIARGEGTLALAIQDGGVIETASKTIPILLQTVDIQFYPEGGNLAAGQSNRIYFEARQPNGKPADVEGVVSDGTTRVTLKTEHEGRGRFDFTPKDDSDYVVRITKPAGIRTVYKLPKATTSVALRVLQDVIAKDQPIKLALDGPLPEAPKQYKVTVCKQEALIAVAFASKRDVELDAKNADGVLRVTLWDANDVPLAERLVYREPAKKMNVSITPEKQFYTPGENVTLTVKTSDANGKPVSGIVGLTVTDDSVLEMVEKREQAPRLPVMVLLEPEVKDLADAHVYLDANDLKAPLALDLLLGTQGWRRFAFMDAEKFVAENGDKARRALALKIQSQREIRRAANLAEGGELAFGRGAPVPAAAGIPADRLRADVPKNAAPAEAPVVLAAVLPAPPVQAVQPAREAAANDAKEKDAPRQGANFKMQEALDKADAMQDKAEFAARRKSIAFRQNVVFIREYAHQVRPNRNPNDRRDFTETLFWNAGVKTDVATGEARITFGLNDSVTSFRIFAEGFTSDGSLGSVNATLKSVQPFYVEPKLPLEVTSGDTILLPINVINSIASDLPGATLKIDLKGEFKIADIQPFDLKGMDRSRQLVKIETGFGNGIEDFTLTAKAGPYEDKVTRKFNLKPKGFPIEVPFGGMIGPNTPITHTIVIPDTVIPRSIVTSANVYPTPLANMTEALQSLIQSPSGCFEQTSSTSYPLTMAQQYFMSHAGVDPKLIERSREKLDDGYKRLVSFWCPDRGYEWFGQNPGHEALTAFGVMHFADMAQVREVDRAMIDSTRGWLLKQRDGKGGFERKRRALHTWIEDKDCSNAYIVWALLESGEKAENMKTEIAALKTAASASSNSYVHALAGNIFAISGDKAEAAQMNDRLLAKQTKDGLVDGGTATIVGSGGEALQIETTALTTLSWLRDTKYAGAVEKSMKYLADSCKGGRYGSTQSTVLALRAIVAYDKQRARPKAPGKVRIFVDGQSIGGPCNFDTTTQGAIQLPDLSELLTKGEHKIELKMEDGGEMPYAIAINYNTLQPNSSKECKVDVAVTLANENVVEGAATEANVTVTNKTKEVIPTPIAIVGIPGGLEVRHDQLKELVKKGTIDCYEVLGREVVLYWRTINADSKVEVPLSLIAAIPGTYTAPASRAYLYYTDEHKNWTPGVKVTISPK